MSSVSIFKGNMIKNKKIKKKKKYELVGTVSVHKRGFGFLILDDQVKEDLKWDLGDVFVKKNNLKDAMDGDKVILALEPKNTWKNSPEGRVIKVLERAHTHIVGTMDRNKEYGFVIPSNNRLRDDIFIRGRNLKGAKDGDIVRVEITKYKTATSSPEGKVLEIISKDGQPGGDIKAMIVGSGRSLQFDEQVINKAKSIEGPTLIEKEIRNRKDLRDKMIFTIDGDDSKDFDDGVSLEILDDGTYKLGVHIADVSFYVKEDDVIDREALKRANSVYLLNQVVPMLPEKLSNDLCSLKPKVDRLAFSCEMIFDSKGKMLDYSIFESVINSKARLTYNLVASLLENKDKIKETDLSWEVLETLIKMRELAEIFISERDKRGSIDFDTKEPKIILDKNGKAKDVIIAERNIAHRIIEEFMLKANECVASYISWMELPFIYRNHRSPKEEKMLDMRKFLGGLGLNIRGDISDIKPFQIKEVIDNSRGEKCEDLVQRAMLRSMEKAEYTVDNEGHFGLALKNYCHFTSPIRRYPDLIVHRILKSVIKEGSSKIDNDEFKEKCQRISNHCSKIERDTMELERDVEKMKLTEYMHSQIGKTFKGVVSGFTNYGLYVEVKGCIDGRVSIDDMNEDIFVAEPERFRMVGLSTGKIYSLGDEVTVEVSWVDVENREIDLIFAQ